MLQYLVHWTKIFERTSLRRAVKLEFHHIRFSFRIRQTGNEVLFGDSRDAGVIRCIRRSDVISYVYEHWQRCIIVRNRAVTWHTCGVSRSSYERHIAYKPNVMNVSSLRNLTETVKTLRVCYLKWMQLNATDHCIIAVKWGNTVITMAVISVSIYDFIFIILMPRYFIKHVRNKFSQSVFRSMPYDDCHCVDCRPQKQTTVSRCFIYKGWEMLQNLMTSNQLSFCLCKPLAPLSCPVIPSPEGLRHPTFIR